MGLDIFFSKSSTIGYFRKVNFLVKYFENLGFDVEHQLPFTITKENAEILLSRCNQVLEDNSKAPELLPTMEGFFFGSTDYDEYYVNDIKDTIDIVTKVLETTDFEKEMVYYVSSW